MPDQEQTYEMKLVLGFLKDQLTEFKEGMNIIANKIEALTEKVNEIKVCVSKYDEKINSILKQISDHESRIKYLEDKTSSLKAADSAIAGEVKGRDHATSTMWSIISPILFFILGWLFTYIKALIETYGKVG